MLKHNKKKNSLIVYEQLLTLATRLAHNKKVDEFNFVVETVKSFFSPSTALGKEKKILQSVTESKLKTDADADLLLKECLNEYSVINQRNLELEKVALINRINKQIGPELFKLPVKNYKLYASAQIMVNEHSNGFKDSSPTERVKIHTILKENIKAQPVIVEDLEVDNVTYKILINKFNEKYGPHINENQAEILKMWLKSLVTEDYSEVKKEILGKVKMIKEEISKALKMKNSKSSEYYELLMEAKQTLSGYNEDKEVTEDLIYEIMRYCDVVEDLKDAK